MHPLSSKLLDIRNRLSTLLKTESENAPAHVKIQLEETIDLISQAIAELSTVVIADTSMEKELHRTTKTPLKHGEDGPHPIKWGF